MRYFAVLLLFVACTYIHPESGSFRYEAKLDTVGTSGFYRILLSPEITSKLRSRLNDISLVNEQNEEVKYSVIADYAADRDMFQWLKVLKSYSKPGCCSYCLLENRAKDTLTNLSFGIRYNNFKRKFILRGSDDKKNWDIIKDWNKLTSQTTIENYDSSLLSFDFKPCAYRYFQLESNDSFGTQLGVGIEVLAAGFQKHFSQNGTYTRIRGAVIQQKNDTVKKTSVVTVGFPQMTFATVLEFYYSGTPGQATCQHFYENYRELSADYLKDSKANVFSKHGGVHADTFRIAMHNQTDPPITIDSVRVWQKKTYLACYLKANEKYTLRFGRENVKSHESLYDSVGTSLSNKLYTLPFARIQEIKEVGR